MVTTPPVGVTATTPFGLSVTAENPNGVVDTTYTGPVKLTLAGGDATATLGGTVTVTAVNGVAAFTDLTIDKVGTGYTLTATSGTLTLATTSSFDVARHRHPARGHDAPRWRHRDHPLRP